ncbi:MAG: hypothetical protein NC253_12850 [Ruminococcus sp.]|nr:hypothetical protein [Ruminococcus sp.]MCM1480061.1 hypothetical protein [Muribaculaceae bacterium]
MNKKILAAVCFMVLLCACGKDGGAEMTETVTESVSAAAESVSETAVSTAAETFSEETERVTETSAEETKEAVTREFFNDDVVFEEVMMPVKTTVFNIDGTASHISFFEYDIAGNECAYQEDTHEFDCVTKYDYRPDGTYSKVFKYYNGEDTPSLKKYYDEHGYCIEINSEKYEYEFDEAGRLIRKTFNSIEDKYTYDEEGRLYEEFNISTYGVVRRKHEYIGNIENVYYFSDGFEDEKLWKIIVKDENGNVIKETRFADAYLGELAGQAFIEYTYDDMNRLIYENHTVSDNYVYDADDAINKVYLLSYEYEGDKLKKESRTYSGRSFVNEYFYGDNGSMIMKNYADDVIILETEYAAIPKIKTDIEYKYYMDILP